MTNRFKNYSATTIARLLDKNELEGRDFFDCIFRAIVLLRKQAKEIKELRAMLTATKPRRAHETES